MSISNEPSSSSVWLGILGIAIQAENILHDSVTGGQPIQFSVNAAIMHLNGGIGKTKGEETLDIGNHKMKIL